MLFDFGPENILALSGWTLFIFIFIGPFIQEDVAVIGAATASLAGLAPTAAILAVVYVGLIGSDAWKYWMGHLARRNEWAHKFAEKPGVSIAGNLIHKEFFQTMMMARFVPGTRIPTYIAAGFFKAPYVKYIVTLAATAALYVAIIFGLFHGLGAIAGEGALLWLPAIAVVALVGYIVFRWLNHTKKHEGPMTPLTAEFDHPMSDMPGFEGNPLEGENTKKE